MNSPLSIPRLRRVSGFSLLEVLVAVGLMSILVLALYSMFDQTQKALRANAGQSDVSEAGRAAMELVTRDVEKAWASRVPAVTNNLVIRRTYPASVVNGVGDDFTRDSAFHEVFLLCQPDVGVSPGFGLFVAEENNPLQRVTNAIGTLYRYEVSGGSPVLDSNGNRLGAVANFAPPTLVRPGTAFRTFDNFWREFDRPDATVRTSASRLIDGVVFFRVFAYAASGVVLDRTVTLTNDIPADVVPFFRSGPDVENLTTFGNAALPSAVEVELGIMPPRLLAQFRSLLPSLQAGFLARNFANILVFRQRIALRTAQQ
jgi:prepilin-type N-terminal cleavage/methylation domain-containing protein